MPRTAVSSAARRKAAEKPATPRRSGVTAKAATTSADKERPLIEDIRLLGRLLGEVIREQEGTAAFELIERVRQLSVAYRIHKDASAGRVLDRLLKNLSSDQTVSVIRAFSYFSHLANIAEDRQHVRRPHLPRARGPPAGRLARDGLRAAARRRHRAPTSPRCSIAPTYPPC
jgi:phosphoenolpyruvate carboxylase